MSVRSYSFREGDRSEYLAQFLLSALGLCSPVPRQEDIGYDFACSIANQESGLITFGFPYLISIKSRSRPVVKVKPTKSGIQANDESNVEWLFPGQPTMLGVVDKKKVSIAVYSMLPLWFLHWAGPSDIGTMHIKPRMKANQLGDVAPPVRGAELDNWPGHYHYDIDLGHAVAKFDVHDLNDKERIRLVKQKLRYAVHLAELCIMQRSLQIPFFYWIAQTTFDTSHSGGAFAAHPIPNVQAALDGAARHLWPSLSCFANFFRVRGDQEHFRACITLMRLAPPGSFPEAVLQQFPELLA
jgi:hypothetical protein